MKKTVITMPGCTQCMMLKSYFKKNNIEYGELNADSEEGTLLVSQYSIVQCPCVIDGEKVLRGYKEAIEYYGK